ncbi:polysaccharide lyase family 14 protein [Peniophora sp. CONT]|nr:polysaccharide lyase family 14 protein [Peniophora sp. CONT]
MLLSAHPSGLKTPHSLLFTWTLLASCVLPQALAIPILNPRQAQSVFSQPLPSVFPQQAQSDLPLQPQSASASSSQGSDVQSTAFPFAINDVTQTIFVTEAPISTTSTPAAGPTVTVTYTLQPTPSPVATSLLPSRGPQLMPIIPSSSSSSSPSSPTTWSVPPIYTNFDTFSVTHYAGGQSNMEIVTATASPAASTRSAAKRSPEDTVSASAADSGQLEERSILRVLYPEGSINPASRPQGGAQFYAHPLDITQARSVTLEYDVYFPADFEFVLGGKLPGLFGGKESCSGGDAALDCFSTRLMWREEGAGELYLYAPKDKQTKGLCSLPPESVCESSYGLSIARGSFNWTRGGWTHVAQTVVLNTPGVQDGAFRLDVDGAPVIDRNDVYYRSAGGDSGDDKSDEEDEDDDKGLIGGLLPTLGKLLGRASDALPFLFGPQSSSMQSIVAQSDAQGEGGAYQSRPKAKAKGKVKAADAGAGEGGDAEPIGFTGLFFSTFFGGHESEWASPKDQYVHFASFAMRIND